MQVLKAVLSFVSAGVAVAAAYGLFMDQPYLVKAVLESLVPLTTFVVWYRLRRQPLAPKTRYYGGALHNVRYDSTPFVLKVLACAANAVAARHLVLGCLRGLEERLVVTGIVTAVATIAMMELVKLLKEKD